MSAGGESTKVILFALSANFGIAVAKFAGAAISNSASMLAEAIHSLVDTSNQVLLLIGSKKSLRPASEAHPLGYGREVFFWSFIVAVLLSPPSTRLNGQRKRDFQPFAGSSLSLIFTPDFYE